MGRDKVKGSGFVKHLISLMITLLNDFLHLEQPHSLELPRAPGFNNLESRQKVMDYLDEGRNQNKCLILYIPLAEG